jgi:hypothetical protein
MVDYYGLPSEGDGAWPGRAAATGLTLLARADCVQRAVFDDIANEIDRPDRFVPFVMMHEFEALLFSDCSTVAAFLGRREELLAVRLQFGNPEEIDDESPPSKRLLAVAHDYQKVVHGTLAALAIGLAKIRAECPHFDKWLTRLEAAADVRVL